MKNNDIRNISVNLLFFIFLSGCSYKNSDQVTEKLPVTVKVQTVASENLSEPKYYVGTIVESQSISLSFLTSGNVTQVNAGEGQRVKRGQLLAVLHSENYQSMLDASVAKEKQAQDAYDRLSSVFKNGSLPSVKMVEIETNLQQAKSMRQIAEKSLRDCALYAPTDGTIGRRLIEPGVNVIPDNPVFTLVKMEKVFAKISVSESEIAHIAIGDSATVQIGALDNYNINGNVTDKGVIADPLSRTYTVKIIIQNEHGSINPGMACTVYLNNRGMKSKIVIPQYAVQKGACENYVYLIDESRTKAIKRIVYTGSLVKNGIVITDGLENGENLVVEGFQKLSDNTSVIIQ